jgi:hypothetical protein
MVTYGKSLPIINTMGELMLSVCVIQLRNMLLDPKYKNIKIQIESNNQKRKKCMLTSA